MLVEQTRAETDIPLQGVEGSPCEADLGKGLRMEVVGFDIDGGAERAGPVGARADPALNLDLLCRTGDIRQIDPIYLLGFRIVQRHPVDGHIDPAGIRAPDPDPGITDTRAGIGGDHYGGRPTHEIRRILAKIRRRQVLFGYIGVREGRKPLGFGGRHLQLIEQEGLLGQPDVQNKDVLSAARLDFPDLFPVSEVGIPDLQTAFRLNSQAVPAGLIRRRSGV